MKYRLLTFLVAFFVSEVAFAQSLPANFPVLEENARRSQLLDSLHQPNSFLLRPFLANSNLYKFSNKLVNTDISIRLSPIINTMRISSKRPYGWGDNGMIPNPGFQTYFSGGVEIKYKFINLTFRPELVFAQNKGFATNLDQFSPAELKSKFIYWNQGDFPERFGKGWVANPWWGQSKLAFNYGAFEIGVATENIWWGPGQFNALTFSNNAQGFPHLTLNTTKPAKTYIGNFETQLIIGKLQNSGLDPSQYPELNSEYFRPFSGDWRYLNALMFSYKPKWIPGLFVGFTRTFQQYSESMGNGFLDYFPVFSGVTKDAYGFDKDANGQDQQISVFGRFVLPQSKSELYFEFGRRDHAKNWREFTLNPEHARAYILGFVQLLDLAASKEMLQIRGEMTQQQESVNRYIRYGGLGGGSTWHTHGIARGFVQQGQPLGVGIGVGSNIQTLEFSLVEGLDKMGIQLERLANNQDFYYKAQLQDTERKPWIDYSIGFLFDKKFDNLLLSSKLQFIHAKNYQWQLDPDSTPDFSKGENMTSFLAQTSLIYFWNK
ncbi:capsule assembly protein Wzi [Algoriphagus ratkowskyi]|uniref:Capsule assembly Wzi family protein n=1 Tax=Algoriphagus ratkowskyi TaxID=57028 RepID=A0A2W7R2X0_9BACT|nr:capsule assembly Wzi family protein [Algoriphagus ratkowskyi]PZX50257.1 capsule assembly protein Wzi [Algoriphagus ratkowskyi]TXD75609.1 capsule assembly Wzi family protein [Algoriphagus ratkowskyi]